ncbi:hypothetical protein FKN01_24375 [Streptomyces sp. 130]|uniref:hypothetical protein n=1 Tax=Streptomyces sp. 130 TaxID=2591006 RepID=UPI00117C0993|nr:hypothetical protein [Streptomyces sp. 130]TRV74503.1 hypothetical protein FKN01_24375 [Streptomyces sp. 130]
MTDLTRKRFAQLGQQLQLEQLTAARRQAEGWRNGLTALTGLVGVVFVLKGPESVAGLTPAWRLLTAGLLVLAFLLLLRGALLAVRAAHGRLGEGTWLTGDALLSAVLDEVENIQDVLASARRCSVAGLTAVVAAIAVTWIVPAEKAAEPKPAGPLVVVSTATGATCGELVLSDREAVTLKVPGHKALRRVPARDVRALAPAARC